MIGHLTIIPAARTGEPFWALPLVAPPTLEQLQAGVGGYIEQVPGFTIVMFKDEQLQPCVAFCNEMGKLQGMPRNFLATALWQFALRYHDHPGLLQKHADGSVTQVDFLVGDIVVITGDEELMEAL